MLVYKQHPVHNQIANLGLIDASATIAWKKHLSKAEIGFYQPRSG